MTYMKTHRNTASQMSVESHNLLAAPSLRHKQATTTMADAHLASTPMPVALIIVMRSCRPHRNMCAKKFSPPTCPLNHAILARINRRSLFLLFYMPLAVAKPEGWRPLWSPCTRACFNPTLAAGTEVGRKSGGSLAFVLVGTSISRTYQLFHYRTREF